MNRLLLAACLLLAAARPVRGEDGAELWLRFHPLPAGERLAEYRGSLREIVMREASPTQRIAREELQRGLRGLLGAELPDAGSAPRDGAIVVGTPASSPDVARLSTELALPTLGAEGFVLRETRLHGRRAIVVAANDDVGVLYGVYALLRRIQTRQPLRGLNVASAPRVQRRVLDHWDNLDGSVERGYAGRSLWNWSALPDSLSPRYREYARANASVGINGVVLTNVNADARVLTAPYLRKVAALADLFRPYGIRVYLTARFSAPLELGGLATADPLDARVRRWWADKADEMYRAIPDFGGFLVKANSEGQPGPQQYGRSHADGANMLADALAPHHGIVMWRAFVYSNDAPVDRVAQAYDEFHPLDGRFRDNVMVQVKNGPLDFQPREPVHPLFGAMPKTALMLEVQTTKEYLGEDTHLVFLAPLFEETLRADTRAQGPGSTVARVIDGSLDHHRLSGIAGVANVGSDANWTGSEFNQANWYAFGRLAWDHDLTSAAIADEWIRSTFTNDSAAVATIRHLMLTSREAAVSYMTPLGLAHIMATGHHYGPGPWADGGRADWTPSYFHRADSLGLGFDRTSTGSNQLSQYAPEVAAWFRDRATTPDSLLLWFHHVPWDARVGTGRTLWNELVARYGAGVDTVRAMQAAWEAVRPSIDADRHRAVADFLAIQLREAQWWRAAVLQYFQTFSRRPFAAGTEPFPHTLDYYEQVRCPADARKPRCELVP